MKVITYEEWIEQTERMMKQQTALLKAQDSVGKSAYEIALKELGKTEEELPVSEWLESLVGENGESAYEVYVDNFVSEGEGDDPLNEVDWLESLRGEDGASGPEGKSAYEIAVAIGDFIGDEEAWLASLKGEDGVDGVDGVDGENGESAYEIANEYGLNSDGEDGEYTEEDPEFIDEETFGTLLAELIREKFSLSAEE